MRVTHEMIANQVIYNLSQSIKRFYDLQNQMSTNRRINKASDDPIGTIKDLGYRGRLSDITQYKSNIGVGKTWLSSTDSSMNDMTTAIQDAHSISVEMSNNTYDGVARSAAANEVQSLLDQILASGNTQLQGDYLFSGYRTRTRPFDATSVGVVYTGDSGAISHTIDSSAKVQINTIGSSLLTKPFEVIGEKSDLQSGILAATALASLNGGSGVDLTPGHFTIKDVNMNYNLVIDISAATTVGDAITAINTQLTTAGITNLTASLGLEGNNIRFVATDVQQVSASTPLTNLNRGNGVDADPGKFVIQNASGTLSATIDIAGDTTVGDVVASINSQLATAGITNVTASINAANTGIDITDTNAVPLDLHIEEMSASDTTALNLGLSGSIGAVLHGTDLNPRPGFEISESAAGETTAANLGLVGSFNYNLIGTGLKPQLLPGTTLAQLHSNNGISGGSIKIAQGDKAVVIDTSSAAMTTVQELLDAINGSGLTITAAINSAGTGIQITNNDPTRTLIVSNNDTSKAASSLGIFGSTDVLGGMMLLVESLRNNDREAVSSLVGTLDGALNVVLNERASAGAKVIRMDTTLSRLEEFDVNYTKLLADVEDTDITKVITDLAMQENAYTAALNAAAKIIQPSLLNFLK